MSDLASRRSRADEAWRAEMAREVERIAALPDQTKRLRAYVQLLATLREDGDTLPAELEDRVLQTLRPGANGAGHPAVSADTDAADRKARRAAWERDRAAMARVHVARAWTPVAIVVAAAVPFIIGAARGAAFASLGSGGAAARLVLAAAVVLARMVARANTREGLAGLVVAAFVAGTAGLAVARGVFGSLF